MQRLLSLHRRLTLGLVAITLVGHLSGLTVVQAQGGDTPPPHLGYGIHIGPHTNVDPALVNQLRMDWVKLYDVGQIGQYPEKRILFRMDLPWPENWNSFRASVNQRAIELAALGVDAIEVHNEPNLAVEWPHGPNAWEYTQMLRVAYTQIKAADPSIIVVSGGLAPTITTGDRSAVSDLEYAAEMLDNGAAQWFDAFGYHPYGYNAPPETEPEENNLVFRRVELVRALFEERGIYDKQIWLTEFGWLRDPAEDGIQCSDNDPDFTGFAWMRVSAQTQAEYTARAFDWADRNWPWAGPMFLWNLNWSLYDFNVNPPCSHMRWFSILNTKGEKLPVFDRVVSMPRRFSTYAPRLTLYAETMSTEVSTQCPGPTVLGEFLAVNTGYPGRTVAVNIAISVPPGGPAIEVLPPDVRMGDRVQLVADTTGISPGLYIIYANVTATIGNQRVSESIQGYLVVTDLAAGC